MVKVADKRTERDVVGVDVERRTVVVAVAGDPAIDIFQEEIPHHVEIVDGAIENWRRVPGYVWHQHVGGVLLLTRMLRAAIGEAADIGQPSTVVLGPHTTLGNHTLRAALVQSLARVDRDPPGLAPQTPESWRVTSFLGFADPSASITDEEYRALYATCSDEDVQVPFLIIDDAGNGFRSNPGRWPLWLDKSRCLTADTLILKINPPLPATADWQGQPLWDRLRNVKCRNRLIVVNADDLRQSNVDISLGRSWERTLHDLSTCISQDDAVLSTLRGFGDVIVRFGIEGAALVPHDVPGMSTHVHLICIPGAMEGDAKANHQRYMPGATSAFMAGMVAALFDQRKREEESARDEPMLLLHAIRSGMVTAARLVEHGFILANSNPDNSRKRDFTIPFDKVFERAVGADTDNSLYKSSSGVSIFIAECRSGSTIEPLTPIWTSLRDLKTTERDRPKMIVTEGLQFINTIPHARFGALVTADYTEIEGYRSISTLFGRYIHSVVQEKPLSIAVFGPPGSGKSFGIKSIAKLLGNRNGRAEIEIAEFNVAQWQSMEDLTSALHIARDIGLSGRLPLVFFDEFDSSLQGHLTWLKSFLAPMQDGKFKDGDRLHSTGKALFVFAGGTADSFAKFNRTLSSNSDGSLPGAGSSTYEESFKLAKGPDFISRLSGYVDVKSVNAVNVGEPDAAVRLRRAIMLRTKLEEWHPRLLNRQRKLSIDPSVLQALIGVRVYNHGVRSMEAVLRMSDLSADATHFSRSSLPADDQLGLHLDVQSFRKLLAEPPPTDTKPA